MGKAVLTINSRNYGAWSLRGWLLCRFAGIDFDVRVVAPDDPAARAEILLLSSSILVPSLEHDGAKVWDTLAIAEYLNELAPGAALLPAERVARAHCRAICGEMHSGFASLRAALPMNLRARWPGFRIWARARADIDRVSAIWRECLATYGGPWLFGRRSMADAMYAPVATRFVTYDVKLDRAGSDYVERIIAMPEMREWTEAARQEPDAIEELEVEF
jgi:glutathione S-transferase